MFMCMKQLNFNLSRTSPSGRSTFRRVFLARAPSWCFTRSHQWRKQFSRKFPAPSKGPPSECTRRRGEYLNWGNLALKFSWRSSSVIGNLFLFPRVGRTDCMATTKPSATERPGSETSRLVIEPTCVVCLQPCEGKKACACSFMHQQCAEAYKQTVRHIPHVSARIIIPAGHAKVTIPSPCMFA